jgi:hypothetical protein
MSLADFPGYVPPNHTAAINNMNSCFPLSWLNSPRRAIIVAEKANSVTVTKKNKPSKSIPVETLPLLGVPRRRGRPSTGKALSSAERQRRFRESRRIEARNKAQSALVSFHGEDDNELLQWLVSAGPALQEKAWIELGRRKGWKMP